MRHAERAARELLETAWHRDGQGFAIPVDPFSIARSIGAQVAQVHLDNDVSGMLVKQPGRDPVVYVSASDSINRQRFTCAHELGHLVVRNSSRRDDSFGFVDRRDEMASMGRNPAEIYANQFAAELLMPQDVVRARAGVHAAALAAMFQVSLGAMQFRLENLGLQ